MGQPYEVLLWQMISNPPPLDEPLPLTNRKETIYGTVFTFWIIAWLAVFFRLWVRFKVVKEIGWDDVFVLLAQVLNTGATILVHYTVEQGLGKHMLNTLGTMMPYLQLFYVQHALYVTNCAVIKIALLLQYLRIFKAGAMRWVCIGLLVAVGLWGLTFSFMAWFPCFPVKAYWDRTTRATNYSSKPDYKCYGFGFAEDTSFVATYKAHSTSNMMFDVLIFLAPMVLFRTPNLKFKNIVAMAGVFTFGAVVVATSIWRLESIIATRGATLPYLDFTWWSPLLIILSCLEIDLAIICASMPIFWPIIQKSLAAIFVSYEVQVVEERVDNYYELEQGKGMNRSGSLKSNGTSTQELTHEDDDTAHGRKPEFTVGFDPLNDDVNRAGFTTKVQTKEQPKWEL